MLEVNHIGRSKTHERFLAENGIHLLNCESVDFGGKWDYISFQFPGEHCTECAAPDCHESCDLFERGCTGRCMRFADGIVVRKCKSGPFPYYLEVLFKRWAQLLCVGNVFCVQKKWYQRLAWTIPAVGRIFCLCQSTFRFLPMRTQWRVSDRIRGFGNRLPRILNSLASSGKGGPAEELVCLVGNPAPEDVLLELWLSGFGDSQGGRSFRKTYRLSHGWNELSVSRDEFDRLIDLQGLFRISMVPLADKPVLLQIMYLGFVGRGKRSGVMGQRPEVRVKGKVKLLVVDLDNTVWDGILIENPDSIPRLKPGVVETLRELDARGVLLSVASKNNFEDARRVLEHHGIWDLFLHPEIAWTPKSGMVSRIVEQLNIGMDSVAFIDDSQFELGEVKSVLPEVRTYRESEFAELTSLAEFDVPVTEDSQRRRKLYIEEGRRKQEFYTADLHYDGFLKSCSIELKLEGLNEDNRDRVFELVQRTNQLNYSGNRYSRDYLTEVLTGAGSVPVVMRCSDKYGEYGIIGFAILKKREQILEIEDMMFSCRIQGKKIEHSFIAHLVAVGQTIGLEKIHCRFRRTKRNAPAAKLFNDMGFEPAGNPASEKSEIYELQCSPDIRSSDYPAKVVDSIGLGGTAG